MFETDTKFVSCNEYSGAAEIKRCRHMFESGEMPIMLLTERRYIQFQLLLARYLFYFRHFYHRVIQRKVQRIIFFQPPTFGHFYPEIVNFIISPTNADVTTFYTR